MNTQTTISQDVNLIANLLTSFEQPKPSQKEREFQAQVIDRLMHRKYVPFTVARSMVEDFEGTVKWGYLFNNSPEMVAGQVWQRAKNGLPDTDI